MDDLTCIVETLRLSWMSLWRRFYIKVTVVNVLYVSESIMKNVTARCVCPNSCDVTYYRVSTSYASTSQITRTGFGMLKVSEKRLWYNVRNAVDKGEFYMTTRQVANTIEVMKALGNEIDLDVGDIIEKLPKMYVQEVVVPSYNFIMEIGFQKMEDILRYGFIAAWDEYKMDECVSSSYELSEIISHSLDGVNNENWRAAVRLRLQETFLLLKKMLHTLDLVHHARCNAIPLLNVDTPTAHYDSFYLTELFNQTAGIHDAYIRLRGHVIEITENVDKLINLTSDAHRNGEMNYTIEYLNYTKELANASLACLTDLRFYETLVFRRPLHRLLRAKRKFEDYKGRISAIDESMRHDIALLGSTLARMFQRVKQFKNVDTDGMKTVENFLQGMFTNKFVSKLDLADTFLSESITQVLSTLANYSANVAQLLEHLISRFRDVHDLDCELTVAVASEPLLQTLFAKFSDRYRKGNSSEKDDIKAYFYINVNNESEGLIAAENIFKYNGEVLEKGCPEVEVAFGIEIKSAVNTLYTWLNDVSSYRTQLASFRRNSRLDAPFFR